MKPDVTYKNVFTTPSKGRGELRATFVVAMENFLSFGFCCPYPYSYLNSQRVLKKHKTMNQLTIEQSKLMGQQ
jgi:hypothetical protein